MKAPTCKACGGQHFSTQPCPKRPKARPARRGSGGKIITGLKQAVKHAQGDESAVKVTQFVGVRLPVDLIERIDKEAKRTKSDRSAVIRAALETGVRK